MAQANPDANGADPAAEVIPGAIDPDPNADPASGGDTPPAADPANSVPKEPPMIPKDRLDEVIGERNTLRTQVDTLTQQVTYLTEVVAKHQSGAVTTPKEQDKAQDALDTLIADGQVTKPEAQKLQRIIDAMGYKRGDAPDPSATKVTELERKVDLLTNKYSADADAKEKVDALKEYEGVVTEQELEDELKSMARSKDPELRNMVKTSSYKTIIRQRFFDKIVQNEVDRVSKAKPKNAPKVDPSKSAPVRKPDAKEIKYDPKNPKAYDRAIREEMRAKLRAPAN